MATDCSQQNAEEAIRHSLVFRTGPDIDHVHYGVRVAQLFIVFSELILVCAYKIALA